MRATFDKRMPGRSGEVITMNTRITIEPCAELVRLRFPDADVTLTLTLADLAGLRAEIEAKQLQPTVEG